LWAKRQIQSGSRGSKNGGLRRELQEGAAYSPVQAPVTEHYAIASYLRQQILAPSISLEELERLYIQQVLADSATLEDAAARLGINPTTLWRKRKRYGLE